ncbi:MAG: class II fructose-bisphosphatase [Candidatus Dormibacter sp.]|uniref:class II fructose-bisphosphatase n=1 Tax=Candidatus Dormibacter sp. TaxID=2973982 RepID=UPI000DB18745|nr:MAG: class II fructose-bisphosphatase [Candidatus Dormibacteraeota bacterium]
MGTQQMDRNLALELLRVTENAALAAAPLQGRGLKEEADQRAVDAMRSALASVDMRGTVVIGEGEKDEAPMLYFGEEVGNGLEPEVDVAVDPIDGTRLAANGQPGAMAVVALAERDSMFTTHVHYMEKLIVGRRARGVIDIEMPVEWNMRRIAKAEGLHPRDLVVVILDRERNEPIIRQVREVGARIRLISDGDVAGAIMAALETKTGMHALMGSGGATEGVIAACAVKALGGDMQGKLLLRDDDERRTAEGEGHAPGRILGIDDLCSGHNIFFAATGITTGELLRGVTYEEYYAYSHSMVIRSASGTLRHVEAFHDMGKLREKGLLPEQMVVASPALVR